MFFWFIVGIREWRGIMRRFLVVKKRIDYCLCIFIWLKLGISFGRVNKLIKRFKIKS